MKIRHAYNGGLAEVSDEYGQRLIEAGLWKPAEGAKPATPKQPSRTPRKTAQKTAQTAK